MDFTTCEGGVTHSLVTIQSKSKSKPKAKANQSNQPTTQNQKPETRKPNNMARFEGSITLASMGYQDSDYGKICGAIIGRGGSGIKALTAKFPGLFVKVYDSRLGKDARAPARDCDSIHISGRSTEDVQEAAKWIASTSKDAMDGTLAKVNGPTSTATCPSNAVGAVIGRGGSGLRTIQDKAGDHCHVHYNRESGFFEISASTQAACDRAKIYIGNAIKEFFQPRREERPVSRPTSSIGFSQLAVEGSDSEDELTTAVDDHKSGVERAVITAHNALDYGSRSDSNSIQSRKSRETPAKERWAIREELSKKSDPCTGDPLYASFTRKDYKTGRDQRVTGVQAVPWRAVDEVIEKRQKDQDTQQGERSAKRAKLFETRSREEQRQTVTNGLSNDSLFPSLFTGSKSTTAPSGWGSKPSSVVSNDGVEEMNKAAQKRRYVAPNRRRKTTGSPTGPVDLTGMMPSAPEREMVDLSKMLLPSGPKLSRMASFAHLAPQPDDEYDAFCAGEMGEYYGDYDDHDQEQEGEWWNN